MENTARDKNIKTFRKAYLIIIAFFIVMICHDIFMYYTWKTKNNLAQNNAEQYLAGKYHFQFQKVETEEKYSIERARDTESDAGIIIPMAGAGQIFYVYADTKENSYEHCADSLQYEKIKEAILDAIHEELPEGFVVDFYLLNRNIESKILYRNDIFYVNHLFEEVFNGSNLDEVLKDSYGWLEMVFYDDGFENEKVFRQLEKWNIDFKFTSFDSAASARRFAAENTGYLLEYEKLTDPYKLYQSHITKSIEVRRGR